MQVMRAMRKRFGFRVLSAAGLTAGLLIAGAPARALAGEAPAGNSPRSARRATPSTETPGDAPGDAPAPATAGEVGPARADAGSGSGSPPAEVSPPAQVKTPEDMTPPVKRKDLSHRMQVGLDVAMGAGYSFLVTYRDATWCGQRDGGDNNTFCTGMHPLFLDFGLSFGVHRLLDVIAELRLGLMNDPVGNRPLLFMPGVRVWVDADRPFKIGIGFQLVLDLTKQDNPQQAVLGAPLQGDGLDLGGRIYGQFQYDFLRYVGIFARIGASITARKWVQVNLAGQIGVQARVP